jgi:hypothetical protein
MAEVMSLSLVGPFLNLLGLQVKRENIKKGKEISLPFVHQLYINAALIRAFLHQIC